MDANAFERIQSKAALRINLAAGPVFRCDPMRIAINMATARGAGSGRVGRQLLTHLSRAARHDLLAWVPQHWTDSQRLRPEWPAQLVPSRPGALAKLFRENVEMRRRLGAWHADRLFSTHDTGPIAPRIPHLLLVQQAYLAYPPTAWGFPVPRRFGAKMTLNSAYFSLTAKTVNRFTVQTRDMKERLCARWALSSDRVSVVPSSISEELYEGRLMAAQQPKSEPPYVAMVTSAAPHKNLAVVPVALDRLTRSHPTVRFRITIDEQQGEQLLAEAARLGVVDHIELVGQLSPPEAHALLRGAVAALIPSKLESFGLTYYEAMALGTPVVAAERPFAREACASAALFADADSPAEFGDRLAELLGSPDMQHNLRQRGVERLTEVYVPWSTIAARYLRLLEEM